MINDRNSIPRPLCNEDRRLFETRIAPVNGKPLAAVMAGYLIALAVAVVLYGLGWVKP